MGRAPGEVENVPSSRARKLLAKGAAVVAVALSAMSGLIGTAAANPETQLASDAQLFINSGSGDGCMDLTSYAAGTPVSLYRCNLAITRSQVFLTSGDGTIRSLHNGYCLDLRSYTTGAVVHIQPCHQGASQKRHFWGDRTISPNSSRTLCMDLTSYNNGTPVTLHPCNGALSQVWRSHS
ncbi:RICIN domain-containing protein [Lentzea sp. JNUCC 0626]|uniref:RICIN domain-containing protein n=1 Tax=Lentzea sp. JNUCC 0626 TaxID=3367513 RepID=UPI0037493E2E